MSETGNGSNNAVEEALRDHHLEEVAEMIERAQAHKPPSESPFTENCAGCRRGS